MTRVTRFASLLVLSCAASSAQAYSVYTTEASFLSALGGSVTTIDFDSETPGAISNGSSIDGATFTNTPSIVLTPPDDDLFIEDIFSTTSGVNSLGTFDTFGFYGGDSTEIDFNMGPLRGAGLYVIGEIEDTGDVDAITGDPILAPINIADDFTLTTDQGDSASNVGTADIMLADGAAFFIGLIADDPSEYFGTFTLSSFPANFVYYIDDVSVSPVPLPAAAWLFGSALIGLLGFNRRRLHTK